MKKAIILLSFGTSVEEARQRDIAPVETALRSCTKLPCITAYTSPTIRKILARRGETVPGLEEAMAQLTTEGAECVEQILVQPTHLLYGYEYDNIRRTVGEQHLLGKPLLAGTEDIQYMAGVLDRISPKALGTVHLYLGHGTEHFANAVYPALQMALNLLGRGDILICTVEGWPGYLEVRQELAALSVKRVKLSPFMLVAGDHAVHDMAGEEPDSWKSRLELEGYAVDCHMRGLGAVPQVRALYQDHFRALLAEAEYGL